MLHIVQDVGFITLREYLDRTGETQKDLAQRLGISGAALSQILLGKIRPSLDLALRIEALTGVPCRAWATDQEMVKDRRTGHDRREGARRRANRVTAPDRRKGGRR